MPEAVRVFRKKKITGGASLIWHRSAKLHSWSRCTFAHMVGTLRPCLFLMDPTCTRSVFLPLSVMVPELHAIRLCPVIVSALGEASSCTVTVGSPANGLEIKLNPHQPILIREINITHTALNHHHYKSIQSKHFSS